MPNFKPMDEWTLKFAKRMTTKIKQNGFMHITVLGERNYGKTYYSLKNMALVLYNLYDIREIDAWNSVLDYLVFTPEYFKKIVKDCRMKETKAPFILLDDAGAHFDSGLHDRSRIQYQLLNTCLDTIKDVTNCLIVTCPYKEVLTKRLREYDGYDITIYMDRGYLRHSTCIKWYRRPTGDKRFNKEFEDDFSCYIPTPIHDRYLGLRNQFTLNHIEELDRLEERNRILLEKKLGRKNV